MKSPYGTISTIYRAEVAVPEDVYRHFGHTPEYERHSRAGAHAVEASGQNSYAQVIEWGEAPTRRQVEDFVAHWHNRILEWKQQIRKEVNDDPR